MQALPRVRDREMSDYLSNCINTKGVYLFHFVLNYYNIRYDLFLSYVLKRYGSHSLKFII